MTFITGMQKIAETDLSEPNYSFDLLGAWRNDEGFYLGTDSGCSCPIPWESHTTDDLTGPLTLDQAVEESVSLWIISGKYDESGFNEYLHALVESFTTELDIRLIAKNSLDIMRYNARYVRDSDGVEWIREYMGDDFVSEGKEPIDEYGLKYPVEVLG